MWGERVSKLPPGVPINFWSPSIDNVSWSKDNCIAVGGGEHVAILTPKFQSSRSDGKEWDRFDLRVNIFADDEVPLMVPLSWKMMSVGEEQSEGFCSALAWSPPGLGKHKRCVLAVLTSNHVLSIWECLGRPENASDWKRACVVNHALQRHAANQDVETLEPERAERRKLRQRIRSFVWSQVPISSSPNGFAGASAALSQPYLAVSNDIGEVFVLKLKSPYDLLSMETTTWTASIIHTFGLQSGPPQKFGMASCMPMSFRRKKTYVDQLAWSPWFKDATGTLSSVLAMTVSSSLQSRVIRAGVTGDDTILEMGPTLPRVVDDDAISPSGQMRWMSKLGNGGDMFLLYPCRKTLFCLVYNLRHPRASSPIRITKRPLENTWDEVSGMAFSKNREDRPVVHITYNLKSTHATELAWPLPFDRSDSPESTPWQRCFKTAETLFSQENELDGHVMSRTYGIDASPLGDMLAVNSSNHPTDGVEYIIASDQLSTLNAVPARDLADHEILPVMGGASHPSEISAEAALSSLQRFVERLPGPDFMENILQQSLIQSFDLANAPVSKQYQIPISEDTPIHSIMRDARENVLFHRDTITSRANQLVSFAKKKIPKIIRPDTKVVRRIVTEVVRMPHFISEAGELSQTITHIHYLILAKLEAREGRAEEVDDLSDQDVEACGICSASIAFESLRWARCANGHQFTRCALSFLTIQTPGTAKACGICGTQYLNEHLIPDLQCITPDEGLPAADPPKELGEGCFPVMKQGELPKEPLVSLARILFSAVDRCVCCGGKFVG